MTRKHFAAIAEMLQRQLAHAESVREASVIARIARNLAYEFSQINGAFKFDTFYKACGLEVDGYLAEQWTEALRQALNDMVTGTTR